MGNIIALLRQALDAVHDRRMKKKIDEVKYSILEDAILVVLKIAYQISNEESERSNFK